MKRLPVHCVLLATFFLAPVLTAAPATMDSIRLNIREVDLSRFPVVYLKVEISRNGNLVKRFTEANFNIFEDRVGQRVESVSCPGDSSTRLSVALLLDRSGSMASKPGGEADPDSAKIRAAKHATSVFLDFLDSLRDEACVYSFSSDFDTTRFFTADQDFTHDVHALKRSLDHIVARGMTNIWRAMLRTLDSLRLRAGKQVLVTLTDGRSQGDPPAYTSQRVIDQAVRDRIPVYIVGLGNDVDKTTLRNIANATGGKYYDSPDAGALEQIFRQLASEIVTDGCLIRYTSTNACFDGSTRLVEAEVHAPGPIFAEDSATYTVGRNLSRVTLAFGAAQEVASRSSIRMPVFVQEFLSTLSPLTYAFTLRYDPSLLDVPQAYTENTVSQGGVVNVALLGPGVARVSMTNHPPFIPSGALLELQFDTRATPEARTTSIAVTDAVLTQQCPTEVTAGTGTLTILPCEEHYRIGNDAAHLVNAGDILRLPVLIRPGLKARMPYDFNFGFRHDEEALEYLGFDSAGTLSESGTLHVGPAGNEFGVQAAGVARDSSDRIVFLLFRARPSRASSLTRISISVYGNRTDCLIASENANPTVLIDGTCERILARRPRERTVYNHPNPFQPETRILFSIAEDDPLLRVSVVDVSGKEVAALVEGPMPAGSYRVAFHASGLPPGLYFAVLAGAGGRVAHPMLLLR